MSRTEARDMIARDLTTQREIIWGEVNRASVADMQTQRYKDMIANLEGIRDTLDRLYS
jgi:hypothetical protein